MSTGIHKIIDHQIRRWELEAEARRIEAEKHPELPPAIRPCITMARMIGSRGVQIARRLDLLLGYQTLDREIMDALTREKHFRAQILETLDDRDRSSVELWVEGLLRGGMRDKADYLHALIELLGPIAAHGGAIVIGRGANFILDPERTLRVRIVAPLAARVLEVAGRKMISPHLAEEEVRRTDRERAGFILHHFKRDIDDSTAYDLVLNSDRLGVDGSVQLIHQALDHKFGFESKPRS